MQSGHFYNIMKFVVCNQSSKQAREQTNKNYPQGSLFFSLYLFTDAINFLLSLCSRHYPRCYGYKNK